MTGTITRVGWQEWRDFFLRFGKTSASLLKDEKHAF